MDRFFFISAKARTVPCFRFYYPSINLSGILSLFKIVKIILFFSHMSHVTAKHAVIMLIDNRVMSECTPSCSKAFMKMKKGAMLINTSRGGIIETNDVIKALKSAQVGYLGIDVYEGEEELFLKDLSDEIINDDTIERLMSFNNVIITPHQAFFTKEALDEIARITISNFNSFE